MLLYQKFSKQYHIHAQWTLKGKLRFIDLTIMDDKKIHVFNFELKKNENKNKIQLDLNRLKKFVTKYRIMLMFSDKKISPDSYKRFDMETRQEYKSFQKISGLLFIITYKNYSLEVINNWK